MSDRTRTAYDDWAATYDSDPNPQLVLEEADVMALVDPRPAEPILDAACGTGRYGLRFALAGAVVTGFDFSAAMLARAREHCGSHVQLVEADLGTAWPFASGSFDKVCCAQALKHLPPSALEIAVAEAARVLAPGGTFTFSVTHPEMDWTGYELRQPPAFVLSQRADIHHHRFATYLQALDHAGLAVCALRQVAIDERIADLLTPASFAAVRGRYQIIIFQARR